MGPWPVCATVISMARHAKGSLRQIPILRRTVGLLALLGLGLALTGCLRTVQVEPDVMIVLPANQDVTHLPSGQTLLVRNYWWYHPRVHPGSRCYWSIPGARCHPVWFHGPIRHRPVGPDEGDSPTIVLPVTFPSTTVGAVALVDPKPLPELRLETLNTSQRLRLEQELRSLLHEQRKVSGAHSRGGGFERRFVGTPYSPVAAMDVVVKMRGIDGNTDVTRTLPVTVVSSSSWSASNSPRRVNDKGRFGSFTTSTRSSSVISGTRASSGFTRRSSASAGQVNRSSSMRSSAPRSTRTIRPSTTAKIER